MAREVGMEMLDMTNLGEFFEENKKAYGPQLKSLGVFDKKGKIYSSQMEMIGPLRAFSLFHDSRRFFFFVLLLFCFVENVSDARSAVHNSDIPKSSGCVTMKQNLYPYCAHRDCFVLPRKRFVCNLAWDKFIVVNNRYTRVRVASFRRRRTKKKKKKKGENKMWEELTVRSCPRARPRPPSARYPSSPRRPSARPPSFRRSALRPAGGPGSAPQPKDRVRDLERGEAGWKTQ